MTLLSNLARIVAVFWYSSSLVACTIPKATVPRPEGKPKPDRQNETVLIIGAWAAGLSAAYTLEYLGIDYKILEASHDFGGRVKELPAGSFVDVPVDTGAEWIHVNPEILQDLLLFEGQRADVEIIDYNPQTFSTYVDGQRYQRNWLRFLYGESKFYNTTWYSYFREFFYPYVKDKLILNAAVQSVDYSEPERVLVKTPDGREFVGSRVIVATPVSVLQKNAIRFVPELSRGKTEELKKVEMADGLKVFLEFDQRFYPDIQFTTGLLSVPDAETEGDALYFDGLFKKPSGRTMMTLFQVGRKAGRRVRLTDDELLADVLAELDQIFNGDASRYFIKVHVENWSAKPYIQGAYSINDTYDKDILLSPVEDKIFFCGEYLAKGEENQATVHGAAISGREAALSLLEKINQGPDIP